MNIKVAAFTVSEKSSNIYVSVTKPTYPAFSAWLNTDAFLEGDRKSYYAL